MFPVFHQSSAKHSVDLDFFALGYADALIKWLIRLGKCRMMPKIYCTILWKFKLLFIISNVTNLMHRVWILCFIISNHQLPWKYNKFIRACLQYMYETSYSCGVMIYNISRNARTWNIVKVTLKWHNSHTYMTFTVPGIEEKMCFSLLSFAS